MRNFELEILDFLQQLRNPWLDEVWVMITRLGDLGFIWIAISLILLIYPKTRRIGICCLGALVFSVLITNGILKNLFGRVRPYHYRELILLVEKQKDHSFPSGHTSASFAVAFVLLKERFKIRQVPVYIPLFVLAVLIAFSRLYLYVHFPSDIIVATIIGYLCSRLSYAVYEHVSNKVEMI